MQVVITDRFGGKSALCSKYFPETIFIQPLYLVADFIQKNTTL